MDRLDKAPDADCSIDALEARTKKSLKENGLIPNTRWQRSKPRNVPRRLSRRELYQLACTNMLTADDLRSQLPKSQVAEILALHTELAYTQSSSAKEGYDPKAPGNPVISTGRQNVEGPLNSQQLTELVEPQKRSKKTLPVFVYNTLCVPDVLAQVIGREDTYELARAMAPAVLPDYTQAMVKDAPFPAAVWSGDARSRLALTLNTRDAHMFPGRRECARVTRKILGKRADGTNYTSWEVPKDVEVTELLPKDSKELRIETHMRGQVAVGLNQDELDRLDRHMGCRKNSYAGQLSRREAVTIELEVRLRKETGPALVVPKPIPMPDPSSTYQWDDGMMVDERPYTEAMQAHLNDEARHAPVMQQIVRRMKLHAARLKEAEYADELKRLRELDANLGLVYQPGQGWDEFKAKGEYAHIDWTPAITAAQGNWSKRARALSTSKAQSLSSLSLSTGGRRSRKGSITDKEKSSAASTSGDDGSDTASIAPFPTFPDKLSALGAIDLGRSDEDFFFPLGEKQQGQAQARKTKKIQLEAWAYIYTGPGCEIESGNERAYTQIPEMLAEEGMEMYTVKRIMKHYDDNLASHESKRGPYGVEKTRILREQQARQEAGLDSDGDGEGEAEDENARATRYHAARGKDLFGAYANFNRRPTASAPSGSGSGSGSGSYNFFKMMRESNVEK